MSRNHIKYMEARLRTIRQEKQDLINEGLRAEARIARLVKSVESRKRTEKKLLIAILALALSTCYLYYKGAEYRALDVSQECSHE